MKDNIEVLLDDAGARWRSGQQTPAEPNWERISARSRKPLWAAAAVLAVIAGLVVALLAPGGKSTPAHLKSAPIAWSRLPYAKGATVPPPFVPQVPGLGPTFCPSSVLTGSMSGRGEDTAVLTVRLKPGVHLSCMMPPAVPNPVQLFDRAGHMRSVGVDAIKKIPVNPPTLYEYITLRPGRAATMYLRGQGNTRCGGTIEKAVIYYNGLEGSAPLTVPVRGLGGCVAGSYEFGPFSTPGHAIAYPNENWSKFRATLDFPAEIARTGKVAFHATLTNRGKMAVPLAPCPWYSLDLSGHTYGYYDRGSIGCPQKPRTIEPGQSISLTLSYQPRGLRPGKYSLQWAIAGMKSAHAETTVR